jgi:hypothetical protein
MRAVIVRQNPKPDGGLTMHKHRRPGEFVPLVLVLLAGVVFVAGPASGLAATGTAIATDVFSSGGCEGTSASFRLHDTLGQGPIGPLAVGATVTLQDGFWATMGAKAPAPGDTTHPADVTDFAAFRGDAHIGLGWTTPSDADFAGVLIRFSTTGNPATPTDGAPVPNGHAGQFWNLPNVGDDFLHDGLVNGTTYYYTAFAFDSSFNYSGGVNVSAVPADTIPPTAVSSFTATAGDTTVTLRWTNPEDNDFSHSLVRFSTVFPPTGPTIGSPVPNGNNGRFPNTPASADSFVHTHLTNGVTYYYSIFCGDEVPNYSGYWDAAATPRDTIPPGHVEFFTVTPGERSDTLRWQNPTDPDLKEVSIRYSTGGWASTPTQGSPVENGHDGKFTGMVPGGTNVFIHTGLTPNVTYKYSIFTFDQSNNCPGYTGETATPFDHTPPSLSVSMFQNPYVTNHVDVYLVGSEPLLGTSIDVRVGTTVIVMARNDSAKNVWRGDYDLCCTVGDTLHSCAEDLYSNEACGARVFSSSLLFAASGGSVRSADGRLTLSVPAGAVTRDTYVLVLESPGAAPGTGVVYEVSPGALAFGEFAEITIAYADSTSEPEHLCIARSDGDRLVAMDSYLATDRGVVMAYVKELGAYTLMWRADGSTPAYGDVGFQVVQSTPNPFVNSTSIQLAAGKAGQVQIDILGVDGRVVRSLFDGFIIPGRRSVEWDGCDDRGRPVAGGLYVCKARFGSEISTHKLVHVR